MALSEVVHAVAQRLLEYKIRLCDWIAGNTAVGANCMLLILAIETALVSHVLKVPWSSDCESDIPNPYHRSAR